MIVIKAVVSALKQHIDNAAVVGAACDAIAVLCKRAALCRAFWESDGCKSVVDAFLIHADSVVVTSAACRLIAISSAKHMDIKHFFSSEDSPGIQLSQR